MSRDYETPEDYRDQSDDRDDHDNWTERQRDADKEEAALRRWEDQREMPYEHVNPHTETAIEYAAWLRREEYGDQDHPDLGEAA